MNASLRLEHRMLLKASQPLFTGRSIFFYRMEKYELNAKKDDEIRAGGFIIHK